MKRKLLYFLLTTLIITNAVALFLLIKKPHKHRGKPHEFLVKELRFSDEQLSKFRGLSDAHHTNMKAFDNEMRQSKKLLFNSFNETSFNLDSITNGIGLIEAKKEKEIFSFFTSVRGICDENQKEKFDKFIKRAIPKGKRKPPRR